jgi:hypothetical protein
LVKNNLVCGTNYIYIYNKNTAVEVYEDPLSPSQSLRLIAEVIGNTRTDLRRYSYAFLLWGWLIAGASLLFYVLHQVLRVPFFFLPFPAAVLARIVLTWNRYRDRESRNETYISYYLKRLWLVLGIAFILVVTINLLEAEPPFTYTLLIGGIGTLASGLALRFRPLAFGGAIFLACALGSVWLPDAFKPLLQVVAVALGYLVPGYLLKYADR